MVTLALVRPTYISSQVEARQKQEAKRAFEAFLETEEGYDIYKQGGYSVKSKRVFVIGHGVGTKGVVAPCPHKSGTLQAQAWNAGVDSRLNDFDL